MDRTRGTAVLDRPPTAGARPLAVVRRTAEVLPLARTVALTAVETARAEQIADPARRDDYVAAHVLVRWCAARWLGVPPDRLVITQSCPDCGADDHGRPALEGYPELGVSLSHTGGAVAAAAGPGPVGIDVEHAAERPLDLRVARRVLSERELAAVLESDDPARDFLRHWVRKEALVKVGATALGRLRQVDLGGLPGPGGTGAVPAGRWEGWHLLDWTSPDGRLLAAAAARTPPAAAPATGLAATTAAGS
ncbi:4'-phosphopantetheinyl transferase superfamily protein [Kitasatospora acidiphila]|uniref:4'-phosphopantetheinyl transferase superfamily protein n=1 Tax=Kitasatospora acidiphila TaxID=2567942 RepID=A0A540W068_9ACTN|nr:4'-phosphopantetheinyl transferase family protein [Kitasatospora acidiphila]TQF02412.1 4'-phosphopantetheinyl transferase superfamily protein [Kitasatospora acidiphila]